MQVFKYGEVVDKIKKVKRKRGKHWYHKLDGIIRPVFYLIFKDSLVPDYTE